MTVVIVQIRLSRRGVIPAEGRLRPEIRDQVTTELV
jgi:hypothetical protein